MGEVQGFQMNISVPNLVGICVDENQGGEISGRLYHAYSREPQSFSNIIALLREMENLFDTLNFPQASTKTRSFLKEEEQKKNSISRPERVVENQKVAAKRGKLATFVTSVRFRQSSTWQGEFYWMEGESRKRFLNTLEFLRQIDEVLEEITE